MPCMPCMQLTRTILQTPPVFQRCCTFFLVHFAPLQCFAFVGYIVGIWAPGKFLKFTEAGTVLCNLLKVGTLCV